MLTICYLGSQPRLMFVSFFQKIYVAYSPILFQNNSLHSYVPPYVRTYLPYVAIWAQDLSIVSLSAVSLLSQGYKCQGLLKPQCQRLLLGRS